MLAALTKEFAWTISLHHRTKATCRYGNVACFNSSFLVGILCISMLPSRVQSSTITRKGISADFLRLSQRDKYAFTAGLGFLILTEYIFLRQVCSLGLCACFSAAPPHVAGLDLHMGCISSFVFICFHCFLASHMSVTTLTLLTFVATSCHGLRRGTRWSLFFCILCATWYDTLPIPI
jgi:hypothetical protein